MDGLVSPLLDQQRTPVAASSRNEIAGRVKLPEHLEGDWSVKREHWAGLRRGVSHFVPDAVSNIQQRYYEKCFKYAQLVKPASKEADQLMKYALLAAAASASRPG